MIQYSRCPVCNSEKIKNHISVTDFNVSKKSFPLVKCENCNVIFTNSIPDENQIGDYYKFTNYVSHTDTKETLFFKVYHRVRSIMLYVKLGWIKNYHLNGRNILDIGSGTGAFLKFMKMKGWNAEGVEADETARNNALSINNVKSSTPEDFYKFKNITFQVITLWHVLEHLHDLHGYMTKIKQILDKDGILMIAVPNPECFEARFYKEFWDGYDVPRHLYHFSPVSLDYLANQYQLKIISRKRMWFDSVYSGILSEKHKKGSKIKGIFIGILSNLNALFNKNQAGSITYILKHQN